MALCEYDHDAYLLQLKSLDERHDEQRERERDDDERRRRSSSGNNNKEDDEDDDKNRRQTEEEQERPVAVVPSVSVPTIPVPRGFYIHGNVGTGKSLLLNNLYNAAPDNLPPGKKRRIHFHSFLQEIHKRIHESNKELLRAHGRNFHVDTSRGRNPIIQVAAKLSEEVTLLCVDEFQVTDVADAMMLTQFFGEIWRRGVVVVATSNRRPSELYEGGTNRGYFLPFVDALEKYCVVHRLGGGGGGGDFDAAPDDGNSTKNGVEEEEEEESRDYRRIRSGVDDPGRDKKCGDYFYLNTPPPEEEEEEEEEEGGNHRGCASSRDLDELFRSLAKEHSPPDDASSSSVVASREGRPLLTLDVNFRRNIRVSRYHSNVVSRFAFDELCDVELGSSDYHAIAKHFRVVMIENIPRLTLARPDRARRFITLIDELYEAGCCLACTAVDIPDRLFVGKAVDRDRSDGDDDGDDGNDRLPNNSTEDDVSAGTSSAREILAVDVAQASGYSVGQLASVKELSFAFGRAASRLLEMCSKTWWHERSVLPRG